MKRKIGYYIAAALCSCMLLMTGASAVELNDVDTLRQETVRAADQAGLLPESMEQASADQEITKEQLCSAAVRVYASVKNVEYSSLAETAGERLNACPYIDTYSEDIKLAWLLGLVINQEGNVYHPEDPVSLQLMRATLYRAVATAGGDVSLSQNQITELLNNCKDGDKVSSWAKEANAYYVYQGFMANEGNRLRPKDKASCEELAESAFFAALSGHSAAMQSSVKAIEELSTHSGQDRVSWTNCNADSYRVYYYEDKGFSAKPKYVDLIPANASAGTMEAVLPDSVQSEPGTWYWSVDAFDSTGKLMASTESTIKLQVKATEITEIDTTPDLEIGEINSVQSGITSGTYYAGYSSYYVNGAGDSSIVQVARSQLGNVGGQPYWSWYGYGGHVAWCACFVSWCANQCGYISSGAVPMFSYCPSGVEWFYQHGRWLSGSQTPAPGYIIFFDWGGDGTSDHVGIVESVENGVVHTIEGNASDTCARRSYSVGSSSIMGYGVPSY